MSSVESANVNMVTLSSGTSVAVGEIVAKYSLLASPDNDVCTVRIVIGQIGDKGVYEDPDSDYPLAHIANAAVRHAQINQTPGVNLMSALAPNLEMKRNTTFEYDHSIALVGLVAAPDDVPAAVDNLMDNRQFQDSYEWHASVVNLQAHRALQRALRMASGSIEINIPVDDAPPKTQPETRADYMNAIGHVGMDAFLVMPTTNSEG